MVNSTSSFNDHKDLEAWKRAMNLAREVYRITSTFPQYEQFGLTSQLRRAAVSVPSNIAEGSARNYDKELVQFLYIAMGSIAEIETQLLLAKDFGYLQKGDIFLLIESTKKPLAGLIKYMKNKGN